MDAPKQPPVRVGAIVTRVRHSRFDATKTLSSVSLRLLADRPLAG
jgi:hypothetical protein